LPKLITDKSKEVFTLTDKGRKWISRNIHETRHMSPYRSSTAVEHNIKLSEVYLQSMRDGQSRWLTERDLQQLFFDTIREWDDYQQLMDEYQEHKISAPDGAIVHDRKICLVEIITSSYTFAQIAAKESYSSYMGMSIQYYHT